MRKPLLPAFLAVAILVFGLTGFWTFSWWSMAPIVLCWGIIAVRTAALSQS